MREPCRQGGNYFSETRLGCSARSVVIRGFRDRLIAITKCLQHFGSIEICRRGTSDERQLLIGSNRPRTCFQHENVRKSHGRVLWRYELKPPMILNSGVPGAVSV
jgi:hypothetical protein